MAQILIRNLDTGFVSRLKAQAERNGRSLQAEAKLILEQSVKVDMETARKMALRLQRRLKGRKLSDSAELIREDRDR